MPERRKKSKLSSTKHNTAKRKAKTTRVKKPAKAVKAKAPKVSKKVEAGALSIFVHGPAFFELLPGACGPGAV